MITLSLALLLAYCAVAALDGVVVHLLVLGLHRSSSTRGEHRLHTLAAIAFAPTAPLLYLDVGIVGRALGFGLSVLVMAIAWIDARYEARTRVVARSEAGLHVAAIALHALAVITAALPSTSPVPAPLLPLTVAIAAGSVVVVGIHLLAVPSVLRARARRAARAAVHLARPRTFAFAMIAFWIGADHGGVTSSIALAFGLIAAAAMTAAANVFNAWTDRVEDAINLPHRADLLRDLGDRGVGIVVALGLGAPIVVAALVFNSPDATLVAGLGGLNALTYSAGPRTKAHPVFALIAFAGILGLPYALGLSLGTGLSALHAPTLGVLLASFFAYGTVKAFPDVDGDRAAKIASLPTLLPLTTAVRVTGALLLAPFLLVGVLVARDALPLAALATTAVLPVMGWMLRKVERDRSRAEREGTHALGFFAELGFLLLLALALIGDGPTLTLAIALFAGSWLSDGLRIDSRPYELQFHLLFGSEDDAPWAIQRYCPIKGV